MTTQCPTVADLLALSQLAEVDRNAIEAHLDVCSDCRGALVATIDQEHRIAGRYRILRRLGGGAGGSVYAAFDERLSREVALKRLADGLLTVKGERHLLHEAHVLAGLRHPAVLTVHDAGIEDGRPFIVMELALGGALSDRLQAGALTWREACERLAPIARALDVAHAHGIVHCDVKPGNLLFDAHGALRLADFGLAQTQNDVGMDVAVGTPAYMAPEVAAGGAPTPSADQFSLAATLYHAVCGCPPFALEKSSGWVEALGRGCPPIAASVPRRVVAVLQRSLDPSPSRRFRDLGAFAAELEKALRQSRHRRVVMAVAGVTLAALLTLAAGSRWYAAGQCSDAAAPVYAAPLRRQLGPLRQALASSSAEVSQVFERRLGAFESEWARAAQASCQATLIEHSRSLSDHALETGCLRAQLFQLGAFAEQAAGRVERRPEAALDVIDGVNPTGCQPRPGQSATSWRVRAKRLSTAEELVSVVALNTVQDFDAAERVVREVRAAAQKNGRKALEAEAEFWRGSIAFARQQPELAEQAFLSAELLAEEVGDEQLRARTLLVQGATDFILRDRHAAARAALDRAMAIFRRIDAGQDDPEWQYYSGLLAIREGRYAEADRLLESAARFDIDGPTWLQATRGRAKSALWQRRCTEAAMLYASTVEKAKALYGEHHSVTSTALNDLGSAYKDAGALNKARAALTASLEATRATAGAELNRMISTTHLRWVEFELDPTPARAMTIEALLGESKTLGSNARGATLAVAAEAWLALGEVERALAHARASEALTQAAYKPNHAKALRSKCLLATLLVHANEPAAAELAFAQVLASATEPFDAACAELGLARLHPGEAARRSTAVVVSTERDESRVGRMWLAEAKAMRDDMAGARAALAGLEGASVAALEKRLFGAR